MINDSVILSSAKSNITPKELRELLDLSVASGMDLYMFFHTLMKTKLKEVFLNQDQYRLEKTIHYYEWLKKMDLVCSEVDKYKYTYFKKMLQSRNKIANKKSLVDFQVLLSYFYETECTRKTKSKVDKYYYKKICGQNFLNSNHMSFTNKLKIKEIKSLVKSVVQKYNLKIDVDAINFKVSDSIVSLTRIHYNRNQQKSTIILNSNYSFSSITHEIGHYLHFNLNSNSLESENGSISIILSEIYAILFEMTMQVVIENKEYILRHYLWQACWFQSLHRFECNMYKHPIESQNSFLEYILENFSDVPQSISYYNNLWLTQPHIFFSPGYCYFYYIALVISLKIFDEKSTSDILSLLFENQLFKKNNTNNSSVIDQLIYY